MSVTLYERLFAGAYDSVLGRCERKGLTALRRELIGYARGNVLEIGAGTGANVPFYPLGQITALTLTDASSAMLSHLEERWFEPHGNALEKKVKLLVAGAEDLPFDQDTFDTVVLTLALCSVGNLSQAVTEILRVLRPGGRVLLLEHTYSQLPRARALQDAVNPLWRIVAAGCCCSRNPVDFFKECNCRLEYLRSTNFPAAPRFLQPLQLAVLRS